MRATRARAASARKAVPGARGVVIGDLASLAETRAVAEQANALGHYDAIIHNAAIGYREPRRVETSDGIEQIFAVNVLAPYILTALITPPRRLVYLTSGLQRSGQPSLDDPQWTQRRWNGTQAYSDSKLFDVVLAFAVARRWSGVLSNSVEPGWVATKMGGGRGAGRSVARPGDSGVARRERRPRGDGHGAEFLPPAGAGLASRSARRARAGCAARLLRVSQRSEATGRAPLQMT